MNMDEIPAVVICRTWTIRLPNRKTGYQIPVHVESFVTDEIPEIRFYIFSGISTTGKLTVIVSKTTNEPADAAIRVSLNGQEIKVIRMTNWITHCILDDIPWDLLNSKDSIPTTVECEIAWCGFIKRLHPSTSTTLYNHTKRLLETGDLSDAIILTNDEEIPVHRIILGVQSPIFMSIFQTNLNQSQDITQIKVTDVDTKFMKIVIEYLYTGEVDVKLTIDDIIQVILAAKKFEITDLKRKCEDILCFKLTTNNALEMYEKVISLEVPQLIEYILHFMVNNKEKIIQLDEFEDLFIRQPKFMLKFVQWIAGKK